MAYLNTRGTLVRSRYDFYESSNAWAYVYGTLGTGAVGAYLLNNAATSLQLDIYGVKWSSSTAENWTLSVVQPVDTISPLAANETVVHSLQPDLPMPVGVVGLANALSPFNYYSVFRQSAATTDGEFDLGYGAPHAVLPPGWLFLVSSVVKGGFDLSVTFFYQAILDNVPPAQ